MVRLLVVLALVFAAPAVAGAPARALAAQSAHGHDAARDRHAADGEISRLVIHDCGDPASPSAASHGAADCVACCCALSAPLAAPRMARAVSRLAHVERFGAFRSLNPPPLAPPPRA